MRNFTWVFLLLFAVCGCGETGIERPPSKNLIIASGIPIGEIKPLSTRSGIGANVVELLYRPLFKVEANDSIVPVLASEVHWRDAQQTLLEVQLPDPIAEDVKKTIEAAKLLKGGDLSEGLKNLDSVQLNSPHHLAFKLKKFDRAFLILLSQIPIVASSRQQPETGEFYLASGGADEVVLKRKSVSADKINEIRIQVIPSTKRAIREIVAGNVDMIFFSRQEEYEVLNDLPEIKVDSMNTRLLYQLLENRSNRPSRDSIAWNRLRSTLDPESFSQEVGQRQKSLPIIPVPPGDRWYSQTSVPADGLQEEIPNAHRLSLRKLSFLGEQARDRRVARILKRNIESMGYTVELDDLSPADFEKTIFMNKDFDLALLPFNIKDTLISNYLVFHSPEGPMSLNFSNYSNAKVDRYLEEARYSIEDSKAKNAFALAMEAIQEDPPGLFLFWLKTPIIYRQACSGFKLNSNEFFPSLKDVRCEPSAAN